MKLSKSSNIIVCFRARVHCYYCLHIISSVNPVRRSEDLRGDPLRSLTKHYPHKWLKSSDRSVILFSRVDSTPNGLIISLIAKKIYLYQAIKYSWAYCILCPCWSGWGPFECNCWSFVDYWTTSLVYRKLSIMCTTLWREVPRCFPSDISFI